ncbi:MAG: glycosyltransferase [Sphingobacteriaceae bacterium]|nr:glycosyltransferase [Sphingobacteriaceae bacterium]
MFVESKSINSAFEISVLPLRFAKSMEDIGEFSIAKAFKMFTYAFKLISEIRRFKPQLVYFSFSSMGISFYRDVFYAFILKRMKVKVIYHLHVKGIDEESKKSRLKRSLYKYAFKNSSIISLSDSLGQDVGSVFDGKCFTVNNGIMPVQKKYELDKRNEKVEFLYLSNLMRAKGIFVFLDALAILKEKRKDFIARVIGKPADVSKEEVVQYISTKQLKDHVIVENAKYGDAKYEALSKAGVFIHPTLNDAFPLVIIETMQFELPVISTIEGAIPEMVEEGVNGCLVPKNDASALAVKMELLASNENLRKQMGENGRRKFTARYTSFIMEEKLKTVFQDVI